MPFVVKHRILISAALALSLLMSLESRAAGPGGVSPRPFYTPHSYVASHRTAPIKIDGQLTDQAWKDIPWTSDFVDIEGALKPEPRFRTRAKMLWDDKYFYFACEMEEPHVWGTLTEHDSVIFRDNDFELFLDPDSDSHNYGEFEINALNTGWDLTLSKPYKDGGKADNAWELPGLKTAIHVDGTLNDPRDTDRGWSVEIAIPWKALASISGSPEPPTDGDQWRVNFSRVQWQHEIEGGRYQKIAGTKEDNWVWSPQHAINMHRPETWGYVQFSSTPGQPEQAAEDPTSGHRLLLSHLYYLQREHKKEHGKFASDPSQLADERLLQSKQSLANVSTKLTDGSFEFSRPASNRPGRRGRIRILSDARIDFIAD